MVGADGAAARRLGRGDLAIALTVALAVVVAGWLVRVPGVAGTFQDDGIYVATARALAEGRGYRLVNLPDAPPQTRYPILYPALLSVVWALGDDLDGRLAGMQLLTLGLAAFGVAGAGLLLVRFGWVRRSSALGGGLLAAASPAVLYFSTQILSEMPFTLVLVAALWTAERWLHDERTRAVELLTGVALVLPFLCRSIGVVVAPAVVLAGWLRGRRLVWVVTGALVSAAPWLAWTVIQASAEQVDVTLGPQTGYLGWWAWTGMLLDPSMVGANLWRVMESFGYLGLAGPAMMLYEHVAVAGVLMAALGVAAWGAVLWRLPRREALPAVLAAYLAVVAVWPWPPERFVVPLLPILLPVFCEALHGLVHRLAAPLVSAQVGTRVATALVAAGVVATLWFDSQALVLRQVLVRASGYPYLDLPEEPLVWESFAGAFDWLARESRPDDVIATGFDSMTSLYTGRAAFRPATLRPRGLYHDDVPLLGTADELRATLVGRRPRFLFLSPMPGSPEEEPLHELVDELRRRWPGLLRVAYRGDDPRFVVFEVDPDPAPAGGG